MGTDDILRLKATTVLLISLTSSGNSVLKCFNEPRGTILPFDKKCRRRAIIPLQIPPSQQQRAQLQTIQTSAPFFLFLTRESYARSLYSKTIIGAKIHHTEDYRYCSFFQNKIYFEEHKLFVLFIYFFFDVIFIINLTKMLPMTTMLWYFITFMIWQVVRMT